MEQLSLGEKILVYGLIIIIGSFAIVSLLFSYSMNHFSQTKLMDNMLSHNHFNYLWLEKKSQEQFNKSIFDLTINEYLVFMANNYEYKKNIYDCKYWSKLNYDYLKYHGFDTQYIYSKNHIFVVGFTNISYWVFDGLNIRKTNLLNY